MSTHSDPLATPPTVPQVPVVPTLLRPDPGSRSARLVALLVLIVFFGATFYLQQKGEGPAVAAKRPGEASAIEAPAPGPELWMTKFIVKMSKSPFFNGGGQDSAMVGESVMPQLEASARSAEDRIRVAMVAGDLIGDAAATERLDQVERDFPTRGAEEAPAETAPEAPSEERAAVDGVVGEEQKESPGAEPSEDSEAEDTTLDPQLAQDIATLRLIYSDRMDQVTEEQKAGLTARHGWFGKLALTRGVPDSDPVRQALVGGGGLLVGLAMLVGVGFVVVFMAGLALLIYFIVQIATGKVRWRFDRPGVGGSVYLETVAVFVVCFVLFKFITGWVVLALTQSKDAAGVVTEIPLTGPQSAMVLSLQWLLVLPVLWPLVRGVKFAELRRAIGWHSGRGVLREMGAGFVAYLAGIPILVGAVLTALVIMLVWQAIKTGLGGTELPPPENPIVDLIGGGDAWTIAAFALLATMWAPIVEEAIFRGCLFRHARSRVGVGLAALVSALVFGGMHGYAGPLLLPVMSLGFVFAFMREWRGSLIAPITAHFVHNATVTAILLTFVAILGE